MMLLKNLASLNHSLGGHFLQPSYRVEWVRFLQKTEGLEHLISLVISTIEENFEIVPKQLCAQIQT